MALKPRGHECKGISDSVVIFQKSQTSCMLVKSYCQGAGFIFNLKLFVLLVIPTINGITLSNGCLRYTGKKWQQTSSSVWVAVFAESSLSRGESCHLQQVGGTPWGLL